MNNNMEATMQDIIDIDYDVSLIAKNKDVLRASHSEAVKYQQALARASNAIEGVILTAEDKAFMDSIALDISKEDFKVALVNHLTNERG